MTITPISNATTPHALTLLQNASLPIEDINGQVALFALQNGTELVGTIGMQHEGDTGLLRSLAVEESQRGNGFGERLVSFLEQHAKEKGIRNLYLLTTTAEKFFAGRGYSPISRNEVPSYIKQTSEFSSVCPSSAVVMKKHIQ